MGRIQQGMTFIKTKSSSVSFDKLLLTVLFVGTVALCIHLMNKSDAGSDEMAFLVWAETQAAIVLGALLALVKTDYPAPPTAPTPTPTKPGVPPVPEAPLPVPPPPPFPPLEPPPVEPPLPPPQG